MILQNFIVLEGIDGSGTTTQLDLLEKHFTIFKTFEPTDGPIGKLIRSSLKGTISLLPHTIAHLFAADRYEHLFTAGGIIERCKNGKIVVCDRYVPSSLVYQGLLCGDEIPRHLNILFPYPEIIVYFDIDPVLAAQRYEKRKERDIYEKLEFQIQIHNRYEQILQEYCTQGGTQFVRIDASLTINEVAQQVVSVLQDLLTTRLLLHS